MATFLYRRPYRNRAIAQHLPQNQSCGLKTPLRLRSYARGPFSTLLERVRVALSDSQACRLSTQSALILYTVRDGQDIHARADSSAFALSWMGHPIFLPSLFHDYFNRLLLCSSCATSRRQMIHLKMVLKITEY